MTARWVQCTTSERESLHEKPKAFMIFGTQVQIIGKVEKRKHGCSPETLCSDAVESALVGALTISTHKAKKCLRLAQAE